VSAVAAMGEASDSAGAVQVLVESGLIQARMPDGAVSLRTVHALVRAAVYQQIPFAQRRALHSRAASAAASRSVALEHRMAAAEQYDEGLADQMLDYAGDLYAASSFRLAAQYQRWSSALTPDPARRERRWLESLFCSVLAHDLQAAHAASDDVCNAADTARAGLVQGVLANWERRFVDAIFALEPAAQADAASDDAVLRYRVDVLLSWARLGAGHPTALIADGLARAAALQVTDPGVAGLALAAQGQVQVRLSGIGPALYGLQASSGLPDQAQAVPLAATNRLALRGSLRSRLGQFPAAIDDLTESARRIQEGVTDFGGGSFHGVLGFAQWMTGDWDRARLNMRLAVDIGGSFTHSMVLGLAPVIAIGEGRFEEAQAALDEAGRRLANAPWPEACQLLMTSRVIDRHARGTREERTGLLGELRGSLLGPSELAPLGPVGVLHLALAGVWAKESTLAQGQLDQLESFSGDESSASWIATARRWLRGLIAEAKGDGPGALRHLKDAVSDTGLGLPLYRGHMLADHARIAYLMGDPGAAEQSLAAAEQIYRRLGAQPYLESVVALRSDRGPSLAQSVPSALAVPLTDRERDVLTLLAAGMCYAQIARDLFITQRTVGYHLSNIYGKAGVNSRHVLTELARREPLRFGLVAYS
jgi:DNA-binding CsgD family transcriptional regulator